MKTLDKLLLEKTHFDVLFLAGKINAEELKRELNRIFGEIYADNRILDGQKLPTVPKAV